MYAWIFVKRDQHYARYFLFKANYSKKIKLINNACSYGPTTMTRIKTTPAFNKGYMSLPFGQDIFSIIKPILWLAGQPSGVMVFALKKNLS